MCCTQCIPSAVTSAKLNAKVTCVDLLVELELNRMGLTRLNHTSPTPGQLPRPTSHSIDGVHTRSAALTAQRIQSTAFRHTYKTPSAAMPTPESAAFLAKKPKVAPTFEGVDYDDNSQLKAAQDAIIREQWVRSMMARLVRDEMNKCYRREGVNHLEKCGDLRGTSMEIPARRQTMEQI
ncbi:unnamed protein product [Periconia digitata]|uniref:Uncharacterized protein n=1 Tax=Periconia digitata TaxID=1303443 RepID=A0A9W4XHU2_9PLEO|nr:unnamed protein product [Periconia digitata]